MYRLPSDYTQSHEPNPNLYRDGGVLHHDFVELTIKEVEEIIDPYTLPAKTRLTNQVKLEYYHQGDAGPILVFLHGVLTNALEWKDIMKRCSPFARCYAFSLLGMGESSHLLGVRWTWKLDAEVLHQAFDKVLPNEKFFLIGADWGAGPAVKYAEKWSDDLFGLVLTNPITLDGYPVNEIQAIGRASQLPDDAFMMKMGDIDAVMIQILKTMTYDMSFWDQYRYRDILKTYVDVDYETKGKSSLSLALKFANLRCLAERAAYLEPDQLLPIEDSTHGIDYQKISVPCLIIWGNEDNMMPMAQAFRLQYLLANTEIQIVNNAGHFVELDQPNRVSEILLNFARRHYGELADIFLGFTGKWKGDEAKLIQELRKEFIV